MIREVDLVSYLPPFMQKYKEPTAALEAENPEFVTAWKAVDRILYNRFISTADEYGISRFEKMLDIYPSDEDTLESRRSRVYARWFTMLPYTMKMLLRTLAMICRDTVFVLAHDFGEGYRLSLITNLESYGKVEELEKTLYDMLPCNIIMDAENKIEGQSDGVVYTYGSVAFAQDACIISETMIQAFNKVRINGGVAFAKDIYITSKEEKTDGRVQQACHN